LTTDVSDVTRPCIDAIVRALAVVEHAGLDIRLVNHHRVHDSFQAIAYQFDRDGTQSDG
jgi:hypothetical protein